MKVVRRILSIFGLEIIDKFERGKLSKTVEEIQSLQNSFIHIVCCQLHKATPEDFIKKLDFHILTIHLLGNNDSLEHEFNFLFCELKVSDFLCFGLESLIISRVSHKQLLFLSRLIGQLDELINRALFCEVNYDVLTELLLCHNKNVF